jgi:hypothetical protein
MRHLLIGSITALLVGCNSFAPSELKVSLNSDKILGVRDLIFDSGGEFSGCSVSGSIEYDIKIEPEDFTGVVMFNEVVFEYAGKWRSEPEFKSLVYSNGKWLEGGMNVSAYASLDDPKDKKEALCSAKSSSDIRIVSLGEAVIALPGIKAVLPSK